MSDKQPKEFAIGNIQERPITAEMQESYLDYAMSVIVARALPDSRDGMKPVHRRILYAMWATGLRASAKFKKSATVVGEVLGKYHPHGDAAVYESMVRMAQDFSMRYPLVNGQGNFGSMDGDGAAAMRYTEAKLSPIAEELLFDLDHETVPFIPNYDGSHKEPSVLPGKLPNLLLNGTVGIAVGMATSIPPHNLTEIVNAIVRVIDEPDCTVEDLTEIVQGPDFPTGGIIYNKKEILSAYVTGRGPITCRAKTEIVEDRAGAFKIIVNEIPYQVNKATLLEKIADLVRDKKIDGIRDIRDESNKDGVRVVIELKKDAYPKKVLNRLFQQTQLQETFHVNMLSLVDGIQPRVLNLKTLLEEYIKHREVVVRKRSEFELARAKERAHILEGLSIAILHIDKVIATIKKSKDKDEAKVNLMKQFKLTDPQTVAILEMRLQQLASLERIKVETELEEKKKIIKELMAILSSPKRIRTIVRDEIIGLRDKFGDERRTQVVAHGVKEFSMEDVIPDEATIVIITADGYVKRVPPDTFRAQSRGGKGVIGVATKEEDMVEQLFTTSTHADVLFFTSRGRVFQLKAYDIPPASRTAKGQALVNFLQLAPGEKVTAVLPISDMPDAKYLVMITHEGVIKKTEIAEFASVRRSGLIALKLREQDSLEYVRPSTGKDEIVIITGKGMSIRFEEKGVRSMGRTASGVRGMRLKRGDYIVGMDVVSSEEVKKNLLELLVVMAHGFGKRTNLKEYRLQGRGGSGIKTAEVTAKTGEIVTGFIVSAKDERDIVAISGHGQVIRLALGEIRTIGRATQGVRIMRFKEENDVLSSVTIV
jgi:DNA gyrase subunit A